MPVTTVEPQDPLKVWECKALKQNGSTEGLNINGGGGRTSEIKIRLRPHAADGSFFPYDHLIGTMLHELVHNVQGPHNAVFYKLLDEITEECEGFMAKGISGSGAGFDAASVGRLGGRGPVPIHNPPSHQLKSLALKAAEARMKQQAVMPSGPRKLGGDLSLLKGLTPAQAAARAAERRARDNVWCPCDHGTDIQYNNDDDVIVIDPSYQPGQTPSTQQAQIAIGEDTTSNNAQPSHENLHPQAQQKQSTHSSNAKSILPQVTQDIVDLTDDPGPASVHQSDAKRARLYSNDAHSYFTLDTSQKSNSKQSLEPSQQASARRLPMHEWECSTCTLLNAESCLQCAACGQARPFDFQPNSWACKFCSVVNASSLTHCAMCLRWKYSYGVPNLSRPTI